MNRKSAILIFALVAVGVAHADDKVSKEQGSARARFAWDKIDGGLDTNRLGRTVEGPGVGAVEVDSGTSVWVNFDPDRTSAAAILQKLKDTRAYEAAKLSSVVACFKGPFCVVTATATVHGAKGASKRKGELCVRVEGAGGSVPELDPKGGKPHGKFKPGVTVKAPHEVDMDKGNGAINKQTGAESYVHGLSVKKGGEDSVINVTVNVVLKDAAGKETLHTIELPVPVQASN